MGKLGNTLWSIFKDLFIFVFCVQASCLHVCIASQVLCVPGALESQTRASYSLKLELRVLVICPVHAENWLQILCS